MTQSTSCFSFMPPLPSTLNEPHLSPIPLAPQPARLRTRRGLSRCLDLLCSHPATSLRGIPVPGLGGRCLGDAWPCGAGAGERDGAELASVLLSFPPGCAGLGSGGLPSSRPCAARSECGVKESETPGCERSRDGARGAHSSERGSGRASVRWYAYRVPASLLLKNLPPHLCGALFLIGAEQVCIKAQGLP